MIIIYVRIMGVVVNVSIFSINMKGEFSVIIGY